MRRNTVRLSVVGATAAVCAGIAAPAMAGTDGSNAVDPKAPPLARTVEASAHAKASVVTTAQLKARVHAWLSAALGRPHQRQVALAGSTRLTAEVTAMLQARIAARIQVLETLKAKVAADTTKAEIRADVVAARLATVIAVVDSRIDLRLVRLATLSAGVAANPRLTSAEKVAAQARIAARLAKLQALRAKVDAETTMAGVVADLQQMRFLLRGHWMHSLVRKDVAHATLAVRSHERSGEQRRAHHVPASVAGVVRVDVQRPHRGSAGPCDNRAEAHQEAAAS
jgi:hypothetical protein